MMTDKNYSQTIGEGIRHDPYLILFQQEADRHTDALTEAGVEFQDVEVGCGE